MIQTRNASAGAPLGLSGVLATQAPEVVEAYTPFFTDVRVEEQVYLTHCIN